MTQNMDYATSNLFSGILNNQEKQKNKRRQTMDVNFSQNSQNSDYIKGSYFQDSWKEVTYLGCKNIEPKELDWIIKDTDKEEVVDKKTKEKKKNKNYYSDLPNGYTRIYSFEEGDLMNGSWGLFFAMQGNGTQNGTKVRIKRTGEGKDTKWFVEDVTEATKQAEAASEEEIPF